MTMILSITFTTAILKRAMIMSFGYFTSTFLKYPQHNDDKLLK